MLSLVAYEILIMMIGIKLHLMPKLIFSETAMSIGNASNATAVGQPYQSSTPVPLPSYPTSVPTPTVPTLQIPSPPLSASTPLMPILDAPDANSTSNRATNLVKPSSFFVPAPSSSARVMPLVSSSIPTAPPLNPTVSLHRPYGAPLLQPFPPPNPPPSLTPASVPTANYGPVISKDKVRDALLVLVQVRFSVVGMMNCLKPELKLIHVYVG
ncbi:hypothetical protein GH714_016110 [Hevea brasiliensis]|uniref:Uncharacterized protein n=1 Tax=Hevea brasiliensis TaxID=3981 RepID=A0A6A6MDV2_HEVBR|nr:hypothetical protein GH714_016110 [Hevea brasiliensis]